MTNFKRISLVFLVFIGTCQPLFSQTKNPQLLHWEALISRQLGQEEAATSDLLAYQKLNEKVLTQIDIKVFQVVNTRSVSGTIRN